MLIKDDLRQIKAIVREGVSSEVAPFNGGINVLKKDVATTRTDVKVLIAYFNCDYVDLRRRIGKIEA